MSHVDISGINLPGVWHVVKNMRKQDWVEISNLVPRQVCTVDGIAMLVVQHTGVGFVASINGVPACVVQLVQKHDGCWSCGLFATDDFHRVWRTVVKELREIVIPVLIEAEARYCEAMVLAQNEPAKALLEWIGFSAKSSVLTNYGAFGKDFILYALTKEELNHVLIKPKNPRTNPAD